MHTAAAQHRMRSSRSQDQIVLTGALHEHIDGPHNPNNRARDLLAFNKTDYFFSVRDRYATLHNIRTALVLSRHATRLNTTVLYSCSLCSPPDGAVGGERVARRAQQSRVGQDEAARLRVRAAAANARGAVPRGGARPPPAEDCDAPALQRVSGRSGRRLGTRQALLLQPNRCVTGPL